MFYSFLQIDRSMKHTRKQPLLDCDTIFLGPILFTGFFNLLWYCLYMRQAHWMNWGTLNYEATVRTSNHMRYNQRKCEFRELDSTQIISLVWFWFGLMIKLCNVSQSCPRGHSSAYCPSLPARPIPNRLNGEYLANLDQRNQLLIKWTHLIRRG